MPVILDLKNANIFEIEVDKNNQVIKIVCRMKYDNTKDISMAIMMQGSNGFVKTAWLNKKSDIHKTLNKANYSVSNR